ncbi:LapA family protein [Bacillus solimangrovi]|uniref:Lipopolysaccharide assembly protein A domain-containing protein n=1 Tax=Bacillus solimangrovi TaxID=1305675 RepID=A0A1E5LBM8_9BACI|nr:lipopolysaccharide assembly protein LapA domain-containing protein [Bacillus solimangrovi]OEH91495.1 hypothetical protein BFG57_05110 [Bacillus solimangrovi]
MKVQWNLLLALVFALIVAVFAVINVESVTVNYAFGTAEWPLVLVILCSALLGGLIIGSTGLIRLYKVQRQVKLLHREKTQLEEKVIRLESEENEQKTGENLGFSLHGEHSEKDHTIK